MQDAQSGEGRGPRAAVGHVHADDVGGLDADVLHVFGRGADVFGDDVAASQSLEVAAEGAEELLGLVALGVADDDGLPAPGLRPLAAAL